MRRGRLRTGRAPACWLVAAMVLGPPACAPWRVVRQSPPPLSLPSSEPHIEPDLVGIIHVVKRGETLYRIAQTYGIPIRELMEINDLRDPRLLEPGTELFVPGATRAREVPPASPGAPAEPEVAEPEPAPAPAPTPAGQRRQVALRWPVQGVLYSRYGVRQGQRHDGIDIAAPDGTPILAAAAGAVLFTGEQAGYGWIVILRHPGNLLTLYAHASAILVRQGEAVAQGQAIAKVGQSGRTSGPHLHFEVRDGAKPRNPLSYLP